MALSNAGERGEPHEKHRVCPSCRMTISVLATKCRYCGEEVGKPKEEARALTSEDLGGETIFHRAPSGSVMEALESFRMEETLGEAEEEAPQPKRRSGLFNKSATPEPERKGKSATDLPDLDEASQAMADAVGLAPMSSSTRRTTISRRNERTMQERLVFGGGIALAAVVVLFGGIKGVGWFQSYMESKDAVDVPTVVNRAPLLIEQGAAPLEILQAAADALRQADNSENRKYIEVAMEIVVTEFNELIHPERYKRRGIWSMDGLTKASALASRAASIHPTKRSAEMREEAEAELRAYLMTLLSTDANRAQFAVQIPESGTKWFAKDEIISDRFKLKSIQGNIVRVDDQLRVNQNGIPRTVTYQVGASRPL